MRFSPRIDDRIVRRLHRLDLSGPVAGIWRELGAFAARNGLARPSYASTRLLVETERIRRAEHAAALEVAVGVLVTRAVEPRPEATSAAYRRAVRSRLK